MPTLYRRLYRLLLRLHPAAFRSEFARDMALDFEDALATYGLARLFLDVTRSLARQWATQLISPSATPAQTSTHPLLSGNYAQIHDQPLRPLELARGLLASATLLALCLFAFHINPGDPPPSPPAPGGWLALGRGIVFAAAAPKSNPLQGLAVAALAQTAQPQSTQPKPELLLYHPVAPLPSYEVATIKPLDPKTADSVLRLPLPAGYAVNPLSIRRYILNAYGAFFKAQVVGGPDWLDKDSYRINAKPPGDVEAAMRKMTSADASNLDSAMKQSLLADRFHLQAHFETRVLPVYELVPAKGGLKIAEVAAPPEIRPGDPPPPRPARCGDLSPGEATGITNSSGLNVTNACAIKMQSLPRMISFGAATEIEPRPIVDHTGFTGSFDIKDLTWAPLSASATDHPDAPSLLNALEKQLGIKLVPTKAPIEVLVIDSISRPSEN